MSIDWRKPCVHGRYEAHFLYFDIFGSHFREVDPIVCPGGSSVTTQDLEETVVEMIKAISPPMGSTTAEVLKWFEDLSLLIREEQ